MTVVHISAFETLGSAIASAVPTLDGKICSLPAEAEHKLGSESLAINPITFRYEPNQAKKIYEPDYATVVEEVGRHVVDVELRLHAKTMYRRAVLAEKVMAVFMQQELSPGVLSMQLEDCYDAICSWELESEEWEPEKVFDKKWYSTINVTGNLPALVTRGSVHTIDQLRLGLYEDLTTTVTAATFLTNDDIETVEVQSDGDYTTI